MDIAALLAPFLPAPPGPALLAALSIYLDLLLRWNARLNLTAVRDAEHIVTRHIGESLFAAARLFPAPAPALRAFDLGSGAGFPGLPLKLYHPALRMTLIESRHKKATFLREAIRALALSGIDVFAGRAEELARPTRGPVGAKETSTVSGCGADLVTMRAVERFDTSLPLAASLLRSSADPMSRSPDDPMTRCPDVPLSRCLDPRIALLIGSAQVARAHAVLPDFRWQPPLPVPLSSARVLLIGSR